jgi:C4-dicarboxylate-specific signal transduction histidine kinase
VLCTCRDVTELKHAERILAATRLELAHAARLALVGELTASIMHEIRQPLTAILADAGAGVRLTHDQEELHEIFRDIEHAGANAAEIIERLRRLARKRPLELRALDVNHVAQDVLQLVAADAHRRRVKLVAELAEALPVINADRVCLQQVLLNLVVNALDAVEHSQAAKRLVTVRTVAATGGVEISVSDTGHGIAPDILPKLFDTFFTTKKDGVGLGLAISRSIVEAHSGRIWVEGRGEPGATFRLALPARPVS